MTWLGKLWAGRAVSVIVIVTVTLAYGGYRVTHQSPQSVLKNGKNITTDSAPTASVADVPPAADAGGTVRVSRRNLDFGRVPIDYPRTEKLFLHNGLAVEVSVGGLRLEEPFMAERDALVLAPGEPVGVGITFNPGQTGVYEQRVMLTLGSPLDERLEISVRGEGILSPAAARVPVPSPPDLLIRQGRELELARVLEEARAREASRKGIAPGSSGPTEEETVPESGSIAQIAPAIPPRPGESGPPSPGFVVAAFGVVQDPADDINNIPAPIPEGETKPDLATPKAQEPSSGDEGKTDQDSSGTDDKAGKSDNRPADEPGTGGPAFTIAPNSSVLIHSSKATLPLQTLPVIISPGGGPLQVGGRIRFPELPLAFGERVGIKQFDNLAGNLTPDGGMRLDLVLRLDDPSGATIDLPVALTTGMAVGYSTAGRILFANGIPRDPVTGDVKLVGVANIPLGIGSSLEKGAVILEILGRLEL